MRSCSSLPAAALVVLGCLLLSCGDDENPVAAGDSPCDDANTACLGLYVTPSQMTYSSFLSLPPFVRTYHYLMWDVDSRVLSGYAPNQRILVVVTFNPPIRVRYDHPVHSFGLVAGDPSCLDRFATPAGTVTSAGWTSASHNIGCAGECGTGESRLELGVLFQPLVTGDALSKLSFEFTVPATYTSGGSSGAAVLPGDLPVTSVFLQGRIDGDTVNDPPAWQGTYPPAATAPIATSE